MAGSWQPLTSQPTFKPLTLSCRRCSVTPNSENCGGCSKARQRSATSGKDRGVARMGREAYCGWRQTVARWSGLRY
jgi:hypothetical protein